jgi:hypothetical protein
VRVLTAAVITTMLMSCGGSDTRQAGEARSAETVSGSAATADEDGAILGREIFDLVDRAMSYRSSHRGRLPNNLRELGIDELTPSTSRTLTVDGPVPTVTVGFRSNAGHTVSNCRATSAALEEAALSGGAFSLICNLVAGGTTTLKAQR